MLPSVVDDKWKAETPGGSAFRKGVVEGLGEGEELRLKKGVAGDKSGPLLRGGENGDAFQGKVSFPGLIPPFPPPPAPDAPLPVPGACELDLNCLIARATSQVLFNHPAPLLSLEPPQSPRREVIEISDGSPQRHPPRGSVDASPMTATKDTVRVSVPSKRLLERVLGFRF
jgi:hypothetical protein